MLETQLRLVTGGIERLALPIVKERNGWCTLSNIQAKDVDLAQVLCCAEAITVKPDGVFVPCACQHGYMLRDGIYDEQGRVVDTHMHLFHKDGNVTIELVREGGTQHAALRLNIGSPSGSSDGIYGNGYGAVKEAKIVCCKTDFIVPVDGKVTCPDCRAYSYSLDLRKAKAVICWDDIAQRGRDAKNKQEYRQSTRIFKAQR